MRQHLQEVQKKAFAPEPIRSPYYWNGNEQNGPGVEWTDYLLTRACLSEARLSGMGEMLADLLLRMAQRSQNSTAIAHVRQDLALSRSANALLTSPQRKQGKEDPLLAPRAGKYPNDPGLAHWHPASYVGGGVRRTGTLPAWWVAHEGHLAQLFGPDHQFLIYDYPLTGSFEFSVDAYEGGWSEGLLGYAGLVFEPTPNSILWPVGHHEQLMMPSGPVYHDDFNRITVQVEPGKLRWLLNDRLVYEQTDPGTTSPWLALFAQRERHSVFRNLQIRGTPQIPREVHLSAGDRLEGWVCSFYNESQPPRLNKQPDENNEEAAGQPPPKRDPSSFDWYAHDGEIHGRNLGATGRSSGRVSMRRGMGSLLSYFRPLRPGEALRYEFFYQPGEVVVYPSLGRLAFLLEPERVRLHWLGESDDNDWTGLAPDNAVAEPGQEARPLPLKANDWNQLRLSTTADRVKIELNGGVIYERKLEPDSPRSFGLFHYKDRTAAQVRNVVLTGDWPKSYSPRRAGGDADPRHAGGYVSELSGAARRAVIGDKFFLLSAGHVLRQVRAAKPEEAYALLRAWVLPNENHTVFQMSGEFTPADPAPPVANLKGLTSPAQGRRVLTGGELQAPALELVALAKKLGKLDELAEKFQKPTGNGQERGRLAMLALVRAAQERDDQARTALSELTKLVTPLPLMAPIWMRWPELVAASGTMNRPALRGSALALLDVLVRHMEQGMQQQVQLPDRDTWVRRVRQARAAALVLGLPAEQRAAFGADPGLKYWDPVSFNKAMPRGIGAPLTHWSVENNVIKHYPGRAQDYLYLRMPLRGDFEVNCELTTFGWREVHLGYGGLRFDLIYTRKTFDLHSFDRRIRVGQIEPPLPELGDWYNMRLVVRDGTWTVYVNDRKMCEEPLPDEADPWLVLHADYQITAGIRNLKITGQPRIPESVSLSTLPDLTGWRSYDDSPWEKRGDTIVGQGHHIPKEEALATNPQARPQPRSLARAHALLSPSTPGRRRDRIRFLLRTRQIPRTSRPRSSRVSARPGRCAHPLADRRRPRPHRPEPRQRHDRAEQPARPREVAAQTEGVEPSETGAGRRHRDVASQRGRDLPARPGSDEPADVRSVPLRRRHDDARAQRDLPRPVAASAAGSGRTVGAEGPCEPCGQVTSATREEPCNDTPSPDRS